MTKSTITRERIQRIIRAIDSEAYDEEEIREWLSSDEIMELSRMALAALDSEPVAYTDEAELCFVNDMACMWTKGMGINEVPLYRHAQPAPVVPDDVLKALQKVARIRLDMDGFDGDRRGIADCLCDAEEALIEVVNRRAAMLAAAPQSPGSEPATVPGKWIPVSERMPETDGNYWGWWSESKRQGPVWFIKSELQAQFQSSEITYWMPLPAAPQEVKP
ncbi:DUF551 domain-containing protein [Klebsiella variicola]